VFMIIIPLPPTLLDILLAFNITFSLIILLLTMFTTDVLEFSSFPTILLVTTLFRLGLNISSTRLILSKGEAGRIINAFGNFV
ncbi:MAG: flagellar biosynthesis protein FlhA, partial [Thermodesulfovibrionales bacterium]|nr:flagellar biosynthesis protein FlhA [Thermodesulfovibrionales bacterium]